MNLQAFRNTVVFSAFLFSGAAFLAFLAAPYAGSAYLMLLQGVGDQLPNLTLKVTLPLLRVSPNNPHNPLDMPVTQAWAGAVWLLLIVAPLIFAGWVWRADTREDGMARWIMSLSIYLPTAGSLLIIVYSGLVVTFACL